MFGLALAIIGFVVLYQRKLLAQQRKMEAERSEYQEELLQAVLDAQEVERVRIGRDLHDDIGSMLATARLYIQQTQQKNQSDDSLKLMDKADDVLTDTIKSLHVIARDLVPTVLNQLGLSEALAALCDVVQKNSPLHIDFEYMELPKLPAKVSLHIYRIVQELITNTLKHAEASQIDISLNHKSGNLVLMYQDNGKGFPEHSDKKKQGLGLKNIESRLSLMKGNLEISSPEKQGSLFLIRLPLDKLQHG